MPQSSSISVVDQLPPRLRPVVAPLVRWAFGVAVGMLLAAGLALFAAWHAFVDPAAGGSAGVDLVAQNYLPGYSRTGVGAIVGAAYGFVLGFAAGWLFACVRNTVVWLSVHLIASRQRAAADSRVLDDLL